MSFDDVLRSYDYELPERLIARSPASPRDAARLLVYERAGGTTRESTFRSLGDFLPKGALLVLNQTKVIPARLRFSRTTGGAVAALYLGMRDGAARFLANKRLRPGEELAVADRRFVVEGSEGKEWVLRPSFPAGEMLSVLERHGETPLPPYIKESPLTEEERRREYQTVFARDAGSIAAPTASLHFTEALLEELRRRGVETASVTLHVHLGTFAPLTEEQWDAGALHREEYEIPPASVALVHAAKREGRPVIAVGTTSVRTLESAADECGRLVKTSGETDLFIREGYRFRIVDGLITNFHVPRSSLMMLVSALIGRETLLRLYRTAIEKEFRFFSFGDGMLLI